ncbi:hypothetical protein BKA56DRAFT_578272 [Ilyonectria sp. MPI-CAGE-AT-0026]|nr:hypothetical protein BKA56DRAFT_578272 [Ilyonectria sp. MPI-CAGE-AT-0026]
MEGNPSAVRGGPLYKADGATLTTDRDDDDGGGIGGRRGEGDAQLGIPQQQGDQGSAPVIQRRRSRTDAATGGALPMRIPVPADNWSRPSDYMTSSSASASAMMDTTAAVGGISRVNNSGYYAAGLAGGYPNNNGGVATASAAVGGGSGIKLLQFGGPAAAPSTEAAANSNNDGPTPRRGRASTTTSAWATWAASSASASTDTTADTSSTTTAGAQGHVPHFVAPSSYLRLRPKTSTRSAMAPSEPKPLSPLDKDQLQGLVCSFPSSFLCSAAPGVSHCRFPRASRVHPAARPPVRDAPAAFALARCGLITAACAGSPALLDHHRGQSLQSCPFGYNPVANRHLLFF